MRNKSLSPFALALALALAGVFDQASGQAAQLPPWETTVSLPPTGVLVMWTYDREILTSTVEAEACKHTQAAVNRARAAHTLPHVDVGGKDLVVLGAWCLDPLPRAGSTLGGAHDKP